MHAALGTLHGPVSTMRVPTLLSAEELAYFGSDANQIETSDILWRQIKFSRDTCWLLCPPSLQGCLLRTLSMSWCQS